MKRSDVFKSVTDRIILGLEKGIVPWRNPLKNGLSSSLPKNLVSDNHYSGINVLLLSMNNYQSQYWLTFNQAKRLGGTVIAGETPTEILYWDFTVTHQQTKKVIELKEYNAMPVKKKVDYELTSFGRFYHVFNTDQIDGVIMPNKTNEQPLNERIIACDQAVSLYEDKPELKHAAGTPCYLPSKDLIRIPKPSAFKSSEDFYSTLFHELVHSTGSNARLAREGVVGQINFGSSTYSHEELVAEIGASFLCAETGIVNQVIDNSVAYIKNWLKVLRDDKYFVFKASSEAQKAVRYILN
jgi:antirestriction protein ArdC